MTRAEKQTIIDTLNAKLSDSKSFYIADSSALTVEQVSKIRGKCFETGVEFKVMKNTLVKKAMEANDNDYGQLYDSLKGPTTMMFSESASAPAKIIKEFFKEFEKPVFKAAYIDSDFYVGVEHLEGLAKLKSKEELIGEVIGLLQSPAKNVISALQSGEHNIAGLVKTLADRPDNEPTKETSTSKEDTPAPAEETSSEEQKQLEVKADDAEQSAPDVEAKVKKNEEATPDENSSEEGAQNENGEGEDPQPEA